MDDEKVTEKFNDLMDEGCLISDLLLRIEIRLRDKADTINEKYEETKLDHHPDEKLFKEVLRLTRLAGSVADTKNVALLVE